MTPLDLITLAQAKEYLKVDFTDEDILITALIETAIEQVERATDQRLYQRSEVVNVNGDSSDIVLFPINSITSVKEGETVLVADVDYNTYYRTYARLFTFNDCEDRVITLDVGYAADACPATLRMACFNLIEYWFNNRGASDIPPNIDERISTFRRSPW